jgi:hypothetical protein
MCSPCRLVRSRPQSRCSRIAGDPRRRRARGPSRSGTVPTTGRWSSPTYASGNGRFRWYCRRCLGEAVTRRHQKIKQILVAEGGGACAVCGYDRTVVNLHFHHVDPATKSFAVNMARGKSLATFRREAAKCVLVCANCHGEIEAGLIPSPPPQAKWGEKWVPVDDATLPPLGAVEPSEQRQLTIELEAAGELRPGRSSAG